MRRLVLLAAVLVAAACGGAEEQAGPTEPVPPAESAPTATEAPPAPANAAPAEPTGVVVYFLRDGLIAAAHRDVPHTRAVARAALGALAAGPNEAERKAGLTTSVPQDLEIERLSVADGTARVDFTGEKGCPSMTQIVYTLTQFPTVQRVTGNCIPATAYGKGLTRADLEDLTPPILLESPTVGEEVRSPLRITGTANTFEVTFVVQVVDEQEDVLAEQVVTATSGSGDRGTFDTTVSFDAAEPGPGTLLAFERSAEDGSQMHLVEIPVELRP